MKLSAQESRFLTALAREQNQTGCRGPAHEILQREAYSDVPRQGAGSLAFSYEAIPLTGMLVNEMRSLEEIDDFFCKRPLITDPEWPWTDGAEYLARLAEAKRFLALQKNLSGGSQDKKKTAV